MDMMQEARRVAKRINEAGEGERVRLLSYLVGRSDVLSVDCDGEYLLFILYDSTAYKIGAVSRQTAMAVLQETQDKGIWIKDNISGFPAKSKVTRFIPYQTTEVH